MLTSQQLKDHIIGQGWADKVGIAGVDRFKDAPPHMHPYAIMPNAKSVVVFIKRILRGSNRGIDEGTQWASYSIFGYIDVNRMLVESSYDIACYLEDNGHEAAGVSGFATAQEAGPNRWPATPEVERVQATLHCRISATLAGLGEIGWSKVFLTEEFGPRQRIGIVVTDAELEPDPIRVGRLCDKCKRCVTECPAGAIQTDKCVTLEVEGQTLEWNDLDLGKCKLTHHGLNRANAPFLIKKYPGVYMPMADQEVTWREAFDFGIALFPSVPGYKTLAEQGIPAMCGARGCIIGCMKHLEKVDRVENRFQDRKGFSDEKPWRLPAKPEHRDHHGFIYDPEKQEYTI